MSISNKTQGTNEMEMEEKQQSCSLYESELELEMKAYMKACEEFCCSALKKEASEDKPVDHLKAAQ